MKYIDKMYIRLVSPYLDRFKETSSEVYQFRCPYCGDSEKSKTLARAYIYITDDKYKFKCHNCGHTASFYQFLKDQSFTLFTDYRKDKLMSRGKPAPVEKRVIDKDSVKTNTSSVFKKQLSPGNKALKTIHAAHTIKKSYDYLRSRNIPEEKIKSLYYTEDINFVTKLLPKYKDRKFIPADAIVIPFINSDGIVTHIQFRLFDGNLRYMTLECIPDNVKIYGMDTIDKSEMVYVFEGPFDSMFCNGVAVANGALHTLIPHLSKELNEYTLVYDKDLVSNKQVFASLQKAINSDCNVLLYDTEIINSAAKDLNDMVSEGLITDVDNYLLNNTYKGFKAKMYLDRIKQINKTASPFSLL